MTPPISVEEVVRIAKGLTPGAAKACVVMTDEFQLPSRTGLQASGAWALHVFGQRLNKPLCVYGFDRSVLRNCYSLTPLGQALRAHLLAQTPSGDGHVG